MIEERRGRFRIATQAAAAQLLVVTERFHEGWRGDVDGSPVALRRVYGDYLGCIVPPGAHTVTLEFAPASARNGLWLTIAGLLVAAAGTTALYLTKR